MSAGVPVIMPTRIMPMLAGCRATALLLSASLSAGRAGWQPLDAQERAAGRPLDSQLCVDRLKVNGAVLRARGQQAPIYVQQDMSCQRPQQQARPGPLRLRHVA